MTGRGAAVSVHGSRPLINEQGAMRPSLECPLGSNKDGLPLGEAFYWMAEKLTGAMRMSAHRCAWKRWPAGGP